MSEDGYSTIMDAVIFLALIAVAAAIMSPAITGHATERSIADRGLKELSAVTLISMESERVDYFEYRVLGNVADMIVEAGGINATSDILYRDVTKAVLGRAHRHRTVMDIAAGDAACQFLAGTGAMRLNPVTAEFDSAASALIARSIRSKLDSRYSYEFTLRWAPLAGVPFGGEARAGEPHPDGAVSSAVTVTMPYTTNITVVTLERMNVCDLDMLSRSLEAYDRDRDRTRLRQDIRRICERCLHNTTGLIVDEIWANTLGSYAMDSRLSPNTILTRFSKNETLNEQCLDLIDEAGKDVIAQLAIASNAEALDRLSDDIAGAVADSGTESNAARGEILAWLKSRYTPSSATATISIWVEPYA